MDDQLVALIGDEDGDEILYTDWVSAARAEGLEPRQIQNLKRRGRVHTRLDEAGNVYIVIGRRPAEEEA